MIDGAYRCFSSWYAARLALNLSVPNGGKLGEPGKGFGDAVYAPGINEFNALLGEWREQGDLAGFELR